MVDVDYRPRGNDKKPWAVVKDGNNVVSRHTKKSAAVRKGKALAKRSKPSEFNVYNMDGSFSYGNEYG